VLLPCLVVPRSHAPLTMIWDVLDGAVGLCHLCVNSACEADRSRVSVSSRTGAAQYAETVKFYPPLMEAVALTSRVCMQQGMPARDAGRVCLGGTSVPEQTPIRRGITASPCLCTRPQAPEGSEGTDYMPRRITCRPRLPACHTELSPQRAPRENEATGWQGS
jgi:hypothetical protein